MYLRQSTAATVECGPFVGVDGLAESTALSSQTGRVVKNGTSSSLTPSSWTHTANGNYAVGLSSSHTDTVGRLRVAFQASATYLPVWREFVVLHANVYDALFGSVALSTFAGGAVASVTGAVGSVTAGVTVATNNDKTGYTLSQSFPANFASLGISASGHVSRVTLADTVTTYTGNTPQTGDAFARIGVDGAGLTAVGDTSGTTTLLGRLTGTRAGYLDNLSSVPATAGDVAASTSTITFDTAALLDRLTSTRAGYLDNLSGGAVALASQVPANFTAALFESAGVFSEGALANAPAGGGGDVTLAASQPNYAPAKAGDAMALTSGERSTLAAAILDLADGVESGETVRQTLRLIRAVLAGRATETAGTYVLKRKDGTTTALTVVHDVDGNRTSSTVGTL